ncbi:MAG: type II toxin-antitoxin system RelE/ParE family toxin [Terracidiphilus sp.]
MRIFKTRWFTRFARQEGLLDDFLIEAIQRAERGLIDADLGGGLIKQRLARQGQGRSGGYRAIIAYRAENKAFFLHGFAKSDQENISEDELSTLRKFGRRLLTADVETLKEMYQDGSLKEVEDVKEN